MIVEELEKRFFELKGKLDVGVITEEQFKSEIEKLRFQDNQNRWWMIGSQSGRWYSFDGTRWLPSQPPRDIAPVLSDQAELGTHALTPLAKDETPADTTPQIATTQPITEQYPTTPSLSIPVEPSAASAPAPQSEELFQSSASATPQQPKHVETVAEMRRPFPRRARIETATLPKLPISGAVLIVGAAMIALIGVVVLWIVLDNLVPGKPISSFLGGLTGSKPVATVVPAALAAQQPAVPKELPALIAAGDQAVLQSQIDTAITQYQRAAQLAPTNATALTHLARALAFKGQIQDAVTKAQQAVQLAPNDAEAHAQFCRALTWNGQGNDAIGVCEAAIQLDPKNWNGHAFLAEAYLLARRPADAQQRAQTALQLAPQSAEAHRAQAWVLTIQGQKEAALGEWKQTITLEPDFYFRHYEFGEVLRLYFNNPVDAAAEYQKAMSLYGAYIPTISRLGLAFLAANKPQDAIPQFQRVITLDPNNADNYAYLGVAFGGANRCAQGIPYFEQALKLDPNNSIAQSGLANCKSGKPPTLPPFTPLTVPIAPATVVPK